MANREQLDKLKQGVQAWNEWREENPDVEIDLSGANLFEAKLSGANLRGADLSKAILSRANLNKADLRKANLSEETDLYNADLKEARLYKANLSDAILSDAKLIGASLIKARLYGAHLSGADLSAARLCGANLFGAHFNGTNLSGAFLSGAYLSETILFEAILRGTNFINADLSGAKLNKADLSGNDLSEANLSEANLSEASLNGANLSGANLSEANLVKTKVDNADISNSMIYGVNVWDLKGKFKGQKQLIITPDGEPEITVDNIKVAQFVYLILNNKEIRDVFNTLTEKTVLILGRFADSDRKAVLDGLRSKLREYNLLPIVFDFDRPTDRDYTETVQTLAGLSLFVIVDVTNPKSTPLEMEATVKQFKIPYVPIIDISADPRPFAMIVDSQNSLYWVLPTFGYKSKDELLDNIETIIIVRALEKHNQLREQKASGQKVLTLDDLKKD